MIALVYAFPISHQMSSSIASIAFALITMFIIYQTFAKKIVKVTEHRRKKTVHVKDELWRAIINEDQISVMVNMSIEDQYQHCAKYVEAWQQMMNTIGNDSSFNSSHNSRSQNQQSNDKYSKNSNASLNVDTSNNLSNKRASIVSAFVEAKTT
jgi:hypothetical protein